MPQIEEDDMNRNIKISTTKYINTSIEYQQEWEIFVFIAI